MKTVSPDASTPGLGGVEKYSTLLRSRLILASASPRRAELLRQVGIEPECRPAHIDETPQKGEHPADYCRRLAKEKAAAIVSRFVIDDRAVLGSDTIVVLDGEILGQPRDADDARAMLGRLSGRTHQVMTAVALWHKDRWRQAMSVSDVTFRSLRDEEIRAYVATGEPLDKAGAYAIQGRAAAFVPYMAGSYSGVMGLPLFETLELLRDAGV